MKLTQLLGIVAALLIVVVSVALARSAKQKAPVARSVAGGTKSGATSAPTPALSSDDHPIVKTDAEWRKLLTPEQYRVLRNKGTEIAFTGKYWNHHAKGTYRCAACDYELFSSAQRFDSGTGWPSFWAPSVASHVAKRHDAQFGMVLDEVVCARCSGHLGHVFNDGPAPTGLRYCINSVSLTHVPTK